MRVARTNTTDAADRAKLEDALENMGTTFWALLSEGTDIEIKETARSDAYQVYDRRIDRANSEISKGVLMQTMTIDDGSSLSQSRTHLEIFEDVVAADARMIACTVNDRLLPLMIRHGFPLGGYTFEWDDAATYTPTEQREMEQMLLQHYEIDPQYFIDKYNISLLGRKDTDPAADRFFD